MELDSIIGNGSYNAVYSVKRISSNVITHQDTGRVTHGVQINPEDVVVKTLRLKIVQNLPMLAACAADLHKEALLLATLQQQQQQHVGCINNTNSQSNNNNNNNIVKVMGWDTHRISSVCEWTS